LYGFSGQQNRTGQLVLTFLSVLSPHILQLGAFLSTVTAFADVSNFVTLPVVKQANLTSKQKMH
jgi:hypothetical protein